MQMFEWFCESVPATVQHFSVCDLMQLAFIKSHLGAFDSKVPVSSLSNHTVTQAKCRESPPAAISISFLSEITHGAQSSAVKANHHPSLSDILFLLAVESLMIRRIDFFSESSEN